MGLSILSIFWYNYFHLTVQRYPPHTQYVYWNDNRITLLRYGTRHINLAYATCDIFSPEQYDPIVTIQLSIIVKLKHHI